MSGAAGLEMDSALPLLIAIGAAVACFLHDRHFQLPQCEPAHIRFQ